MARLEVGIGATNKELKAVLADSETLVRNFSNNLKRINVPLGGGLEDFKKKSQQATLSLKDQRAETERMRTESAKYRAQIAQVSLELRKIALEKAKDRANTNAATGSYRAAQQQLTALGQAIRNQTNGFNLNSKAVQSQIAQYRQLNTQLKAFDAAMGNHQRNVGNYPGVWGNVKNQLASVAGSYVSLFAAIQGGRAVIRSNAEISDSIADIQRTAELSKEEARGLFNELKKLETRTSLGELAEITVIGGQLGIAKDELVGFTEAVDMLSVVLKNEIPGGAEAVTESLGKINGVFRVAETEGLSAGDAMQKTGSAILALGQAGLATGKFMVDFTQRVGGAARTVGVALPTILAYGAVLEEAGVSAEVAGTALSKLIGQLAVRRNEFFAIAKLADANLTIQQFTNLINTDADAALRKFFAGLQAGGKTTTQFYDILGKAKINTERYRNAVLLLSQDQEKLTELTALSTAEYEKADKAAKQFEERNATLGASLDKLSKAFVSLTTSGNISDFLQGVVTGITEATTAIDKLVNSSSWKEFFTRLSGFSGTGNLSQSLAIANIQADVLKSANDINKSGATSYVDTFAKQSLSEMQRLLKVQEDIVKLRSDTYQDNKSRKNLDELNYQAEILAKIRREYWLVNKEKASSTEVTEEEVKLTKEQQSALERARKKQEDDAKRVADLLKKLNRDALLEGQEGMSREIQETKNKYEDLQAQAKGHAEALKTIKEHEQRDLLAIELKYANQTPFIKNPDLKRQPSYKYDNSVVNAIIFGNRSGQYPSLTGEAKPKIDFSEITDGLKRASRRFVSDFSRSLEDIGNGTKTKFDEIFGHLGLSLVNSFSNIFDNVLGNKLENVIGAKLADIEKKIQSGQSIGINGWLAKNAAYAGIGGQLLQGVTKRTNVAGQTIGGALSGAATGAMAGGWIGAVAGLVIGGLSGLFSASSARKQEKLTEQQLEEQRKQTALMERQNALTYTSQIIGQRTNQGVVTNVDRDEFGNIRFRIEGQDLVASLARTNDSIGRGV